MTKKTAIQDLNKFIEKIDNFKKENKLDLSADQDLTIAIMNLISIEEHFFFSGAKTGETKYYDMIKDVREMRKDLLLKIIPEYQGEEWCISKHLLAASMRLMEVGTKQLGKGEEKAAYDFFEKAFELYSLFWGINMKLIDTAGLQKIDEQALDKKDTTKKGVLGKLGHIVKHVIDCCIE